MGSAAAEVTFEVRNGEDWVTRTTSTGDTTSAKIAHVQRERPEEWAVTAPAYDAWKADAKAQKEAKAADETKAKAAAEPAAAAPEPETDDDDDDDKNGKASTRRTLAKGYRK
jgi:hypothetical protein